MNWNSKSVKFESQSHSETISETSQYRTESLEWEWDLSRFYRIWITVGYWMVCTEMHDIFVIQFGHFCFFADTTRKPRAGEEDGRGKSETNRRWVCWKLQMKRRNCSQWQQEDSSVTNSTTEILLLLTGSLVLWINLGPPDWLVLSLTNQLQPPSLDSLIPSPLHPDLILEPWDIWEERNQCLKFEKFITAHFIEADNI